MTSFGGVVLALVVLLLRPPSLNAVDQQEYPSYRTESLDYSVSHRQSVCERQAALHNRSVLLRDALRGFSIRPWLPLGSFSVLNENGSIDASNPGLPVLILDEVSRRGNFSWRSSFGASNADGRNFTQLLEWTVSTYDLSAAQWTKTIERINAGASFTQGWYDASIIMVGLDERRSKLNVWSFLEPFDWQVWVLILVTFTVSGLIYLWMEWYNDESDRQDLGRKPTETVYFALLTATGDVKFQPSTNYARLFTISLCFWSLLFVSAYTANLASFLVVKNTPKINVESVGDAVALRLPLCVLESSAQESIVKSKHPDAVFVYTDPALGDRGPLLGVLSGDCALALTTVGSWGRYQRDSSANVGCGLTWIGRVFAFRPGGFATKSDSGTLCTSLIRDVVNLHLFEMEEDGFLQRAYETSLEATSDQECAATTGAGASDASSDNASRSLSLQDTGGLFIVFYAAVGITVCMAFFAKWNSKHKLRCQRREYTTTEEVDGPAPDGVIGDASRKSLRENDVLLETIDSIEQEIVRMRSLLSPSELAGEQTQEETSPALRNGNGR
mmetsp:Transcript_818/g.1791  ORF Transcript_818/g.1791 Transcript_818/m.1791 type:complete len:558 (-) Transcript_818:278-1951(-)